MKRQIDYAFKSKVLNQHQDLLKRQRECSLIDYRRSQLDNYGVIVGSKPPFKREDYQRTEDKADEGYSSTELAIWCADNGLSREYKECVKINHATYSRIQRLNNRVYEMLMNGDCLFVTLTFNDNTLLNTTPKERRVFVVRFLKLFNCRYVGNIDFGGKNNREHYHAIISTANIELSPWRKYGNINVERVRNRGIASDSIRLSKYVAKLTNHAIKETTRRCALIYSR